MGALVILDCLTRLVGASPTPRYPNRWAGLLRTGSVAALGAAVLQLAGVAVCALIAIPAGMLVLGERRWIMIIGTTAVVTGCLTLVFD
jgi:hypothetical protein